MRPFASRFGAFVLAAATAAGAAAQEAPRPTLGRGAAAAEADATRERLAHAIFERLLALSTVQGPRPVLNVTVKPDPTADTKDGIINITQALLRLCAAVKPPPGVRAEDVRDALIAFVLAHELAHVGHRDKGRFGGRPPDPAMEKQADEQAVGRIVVAGYDVEHLQLLDLLQAMSGEPSVRSPAPIAKVRAAAVRAAFADAREDADRWNVGWLLTVAGRFDEAIAFHNSFASKYPYPIPMHTLALTRLQAAWRTSPCTDPTVLEWLPPIRYDPRSQKAPLTLRSAGDSCAPFAEALANAAYELTQASNHPPARVTLAGVRLMQRSPTLDPTRGSGGVTVVGGACPEPVPDGPSAQLDADACHVSLLAQYELGGRTEAARDAAIAGLRRLIARSPEEPSLQFNLARLLTLAHEEAEAAPLWSAFLETASPGPYRNEALRIASRGPLGNAVFRAVETGPPAPSSVGPRLAGSVRGCGPRSTRWRALALPANASLAYCGEWNGELLLRNRAGHFVRSVARGSRGWPDAAPPSTPPLFVTTNAIGEELRIWDEEAWVLAEKTPRRVVYFKKPQ
jgi:peptidase M48-like protein